MPDTPDVIHLPYQPPPPKREKKHGSEKRQRSQAIRVRVHPADGERLKLEAAAARMSVAGYLASGRLGTEAAPGPRSKRTTPTIEGKLLARLVFEQNHIGSNINQRTRALNNRAALLPHEI